MSELFSHEPTPSPQLLDTGLNALVWAARRFDVALDVAQLQHRLGRVEGVATPIDLCRCAGWVGLRARLAQSTIIHRQVQAIVRGCPARPPAPDRSLESGRHGAGC